MAPLYLGNMFRAWQLDFEIGDTDRSSDLLAGCTARQMRSLAFATKSSRTLRVKWVWVRWSLEAVDSRRWLKPGWRRWCSRSSPPRRREGSLTTELTCKVGRQFPAGNAEIQPGLRIGPGNRPSQTMARRRSKGIALRGSECRVVVLSVFMLADEKLVLVSSLRA